MSMLVHQMSQWRSWQLFGTPCRKGSLRSIAANAHWPSWCKAARANCLLPNCFQGTMKTVKNCSYYQPIKQFHQDNPGQTMLPDGPVELNHRCNPGTLQTFEAINIKDADVPLIILFMSRWFRHLLIFCKISKLWNPVANILFLFAPIEIWGISWAGQRKWLNPDNPDNPSELSLLKAPLTKWTWETSKDHVLWRLVAFIVVITRCGHQFEDWQIKSDRY